MYSRLLLLSIFISLYLLQGYGLQNDISSIMHRDDENNIHDLHRVLLGSEDEKINVKDDEKVIILSMSTIWFKGIVFMNIGIFLAVMIILVIQCKQCLNNCMIGSNYRRRRRRTSRFGDKYDKLQLTTDVTELDDTVYEDEQTDI
mmetsp:Transcript_66502/g.59676  ORF Transcript_66502/g.59676 Transcript_66502/m.59676 type:complete len:145 (+) Transcript_66502:104-538(+)